MKKVLSVILAASAVTASFSLSACEGAQASSQASTVYSEDEAQENSKGIKDIYGTTLESTQKKLEEMLGAELEASTPGLFSDDDGQEHWLLRKKDSRKIVLFSYKFDAIDVELKSGRSCTLTFAAIDYDRSDAEDMKEALNSFYGAECASQTDDIYTWNTAQDGMVLLYAGTDQVILQFAYTVN